MLIGLPGSGKSTFFKEKFFPTHVRISLDLMKTRRREQRLLEACLETGQRLVIDNTNPTKADRSTFIERAKQARYTVVGYYFRSKVEECLQRNETRPLAERVPAVAIYATAKKLERPTIDEGFDQLYYVRLEQSGFVVEPWQDEV